ncbi:MAG TPA: PilZ domain-containing protein [Candidatus Acidoferrum sp.]|nr:PilZ domain-containing protein [Candidatus Acidoferrum sp.]
MQTERPRARRYPFVATTEVTHLGTETKFIGQTSDVCLYGCGVSTEKTLPTGTNVRVRIFHAGKSFTALGKVTYSNTEGMGVAFLQVEDKDGTTLEKWIDQLRTVRA